MESVRAVPRRPPTPPSKEEVANKDLERFFVVEVAVEVAVAVEVEVEVGVAVEVEVEFVVEG